MMISGFDLPPVQAVHAPYVEPPVVQNPEWDESTDYSYIIDSLQNGNLVYSCPMRDFLVRKGKKDVFQNEVHYGILQYENSYVAVVYKPKVGEDVSAAWAEQVAYDVYRETIYPYTGRNVIPPTVVRTMPDGRVASFQFYVETDDREDMWDPGFRERVFSEVPEDLIQEMAVFNSIFNNWDRHPGNYLATKRGGHFYLASIDNESIENRGFLPKWRERSYIPSMFTDDPRAQIQKEVNLPQVSQEEFGNFVAEYGFRRNGPGFMKVFRNAMERGGGATPLAVHNGALMIRYHDKNAGAFPLPRGEATETLYRAYAALDEATLDRIFRPLVELDPERFGSRVTDILQRRDMFLASRNKEN